MRRLITFLLRGLITLFQGWRRMIIIDCWRRRSIAVRSHKVMWDRSWREIFLHWSRSWWSIFQCRSRTSGLVMGSNEIIMLSRLVVTSWCCVVSVMIDMMTSSEAMFGRRRTNESCRFPEVWFFLCFILENIRRKRSAIADSVTVPELSVVPFLLRKIIVLI